MDEGAFVFHTISVFQLPVFYYGDDLSNGSFSIQGVELRDQIMEINRLMINSCKNGNGNCFEPITVLLRFLYGTVSTLNLRANLHAMIIEYYDRPLKVMKIRLIHLLAVSSFAMSFTLQKVCYIRTSMCICIYGSLSVGSTFRTQENSSVYIAL